MCFKCHQGHYLQKGECVFCHRGNPGSSRKNIAHFRLIPGRFAYFRIEQSPRVRQGKEIMNKLGCRRCHRINKRGNKLATNLSNIKDTPTAQLYKALKNPAFFMPDFSLSRSTMDKIINALLAQAFDLEQGDKSSNLQVIHFREVVKDNKENIFDRDCGSCHKMLSKRLGGLGHGAIGPNLSGLFSKFYPPTSPQGEWDSSMLKKWIRNPRSMRESAQMPPVVLKEKKCPALVKIFQNVSADK